MVFAGVALVLLFGFIFVVGLSLLTGWATTRQVQAEKKTEVYDWSQEPDL